ncbi:MAG TPA: CAP domain-containing protein, partial [Flavobacteriales bacterium]|nr:CAP domain-containing protein [Flavobacteriales bacterium]
MMKKYLLPAFLLCFLNGYSEEYKYKEIAEKFRDGKFEKSFKLAEEAIAKDPNEMLPYVYKAMSIYQGKEIKKITSKYPNLLEASLSLLKEAKPKYKVGDSIPATFLVSLNSMQMESYQTISRAVKKQNYKLATQLADEHYLLFDNSNSIYESYIYANLSKLCNDQLILKEVTNKTELFDFIAAVTQKYTANIYKSKNSNRNLYLLKKIQQTVMEGSDLLASKNNVELVDKWNAWVLASFSGKSEETRNYYAYSLLFPKNDKLRKPDYKSTVQYKNVYQDFGGLLSKDYQFEEWNKPEYKMANTGKYASYLSKEEKVVLLVTNLCRLDPTLFEKTFLKKYLEKHPEEKGTYSTSLINTLKKGIPALPYQPDSVLFLAAKCHAVYQGEQGREGHQGLYGDPDGRAKHFNFVGPSIGECCSYGADLPEEIVMQLLVDKDVPGLGHRLAMISQKYVAVGISVQPH